MAANKPPNNIAPHRECRIQWSGNFKFKTNTMKGSISTIKFAMINVGTFIYLLKGIPNANAGPIWNGVNDILTPYERYLTIF